MIERTKYEKAAQNPKIRPSKSEVQQEERGAERSNKAEAKPL
jgi:hypothetical protein